MSEKEIQETGQRIINQFCENAKEAIAVEMKKLRAAQRWFITITSGVLVLLIIAITELRANDRQQQSQLKKINDNYLPFDVMNAIMENNDRFIEVINAIPQDKKGDEKYQEALKRRNEFQRNVMLQIALKNRSKLS